MANVSVQMTVHFTNEQAVAALSELASICRDIVDDMPWREDVASIPRLVRTVIEGMTVKQSR